MIPALGSSAIFLAFCFALMQGFISRLRWAASVGQFIFLCVAMLCLMTSFLTNDFSVIYVREHSHVLLPLIYQIGAAWGGHEGSLLLWCLILSGWTIAFQFFVDPNLSLHSRSRILMILGFISTGFILFLFATSNPFKRDAQSVLWTGSDLTPVLQDPGLIFHPPMLYLGYVGFALGFAFAISALLDGKLEQHWARACRPWIILPWCFLSGGIVLGSWWAYRELGWGGWWFWDPVENASLLPWLSATALLHSLIVSEKRASFKGWTLLLGIITFTLSLLGTFLVRSGVLVSVHTFASDPTRGIFLLCFLALLLGAAFLLYALRIHCFYQTPQFKLFSRETFLLVNSVVLVSAVFTIMLGTLYPIILDALIDEKISVGEPYFNTVFLPIIFPLLLLMGFAPHVHWKQQAISSLWKKLRLTLLLSVVIGFLAPIVFGVKFYPLTAVGITFATWIILSTLQSSYRKTLALRQWSMITAHIGIALLALGVTINKSYSTERDVKMNLGETVSVAGYQFTFANIDEIPGPNYQAITATFDVQKNNGAIHELLAEQRIYQSNQDTLSKPGILVNPFRDLYLTLGNSFANGSFAIRIYYKPFVRFIWLGGFLLLFGGLLSLLKKRELKNDVI